MDLAKPIVLKLSQALADLRGVAEWFSFQQRMSDSIDRRVRREVAHRLEALLQGDRLGERVKEELAIREPTPEDRRLRAARDFTTDTYFAAAATSSRLLDRGGWVKLSRQIRDLTGRRDVDWLMQQAFRTLIDHEVRGLGRMAGTTYNIVGKLVVPVMLNPPPGPVLEIGTLYGLFAPALVRQFRRGGGFRELTIIDPLGGSQIQPGTSEPADPTGTPVVERVARCNLHECGLGIDEVRILPGLSTDPTVRELAADSRYAVVVIDGDHSEDGVYADLWWVEQVAAPGAVVVMDDFGDPRWRGVEAATTRYLADGGRLELLGSASTSAYLRMPL
ncbi:MAG TPA: class I SAM-dependent methyltransferase [Propionibacteriaceae bacterium]|nr:class I SAM-dependent methyltransferase [Propionibacteriaceae bacterium]